MVSNLFLNLLSLNGFFHKSSGRTTFPCDGNDEVAMRGRNDRMSRSIHGSTNTSSLGELTLTPISTTMRSDSCVSVGQMAGSLVELGGSEHQIQEVIAG